MSESIWNLLLDIPYEDPDADLCHCKIAEYDPPLGRAGILAKLPPALAAKLLKDPTHAWRARTGIELIHREPSIEEQHRIWKNWQEMSPEHKRLSDEKSKQLFGMTNAQHHEHLLKTAEDQSTRANQVFGEYKSTIPTVKHEPVRMIVHDHDAEKAGYHQDVRVAINGKAYSWATKKGFPTSPGETRVWYRQPDHRLANMDFEGHIPSGQYGAGKVTKSHDSHVIVSAAPGRVDLTVTAAPHQGRYVLLKEEGKGDPWRVIKKKDLERHWSERGPFSSEVDPKTWDEPDWVAMEKKDGVSVIATVNPKGIGIVSRRKDKDGNVIVREDHVPHIRDIKAPAKYHGMVVRAELHHPAEGYNTVSGILNSDPAKAVQTQRQVGKLHLAPWDIVKMPGGKPAKDVPYYDKLQLMSKMGRDMWPSYVQAPDFTTHQTDNDPSKRKFFEDILARGGEGVVLTHFKAKEGDPQYRAKRFLELDLKVTGVTPGGGSLQVSDSTGRVVGKVGSGLDQAQRESAAARPQDWVGKIVKVRAMEVTRGSLRQPRFVGLSLDKDHPDKVDFQKTAAGETPLQAYDDLTPIDFGTQTIEGERLVTKGISPYYPGKPRNHVLPQERPEPPPPKKQTPDLTKMAELGEPAFERDPQAINPRLLGEESGISVLLVNGRAVRNIFDSDFVQGGNWERYRWIPKGQVWIDDATPEGERSEVLLHELSETALMRHGLGYDKAHDKAKALEDSVRRTRVEPLRKLALHAFCEACGFSTNDVEDVEALRHLVDNEKGQVQWGAGDFTAGCPQCGRRLSVA